MERPPGMLLSCRSPGNGLYGRESQGTIRFDWSKSLFSLRAPGLETQNTRQNRYARLDTIKFHIGKGWTCVADDPDDRLQNAKF